MRVKVVSPVNIDEYMIFVYDDSTHRYLDQAGDWVAYRDFDITQPAWIIPGHLAELDSYLSQAVTETRLQENKDAQIIRESLIRALEAVPTSGSL
jgi:replicative DNA helicase